MIGGDKLAVSFAASVKASGHLDFWTVFRARHSRFLPEARQATSADRLLPWFFIDLLCPFPLRGTFVQGVFFCDAQAILRSVVRPFVTPGWVLDATQLAEAAHVVGRGFSSRSWPWPAPGPIVRTRVPAHVVASARRRCVYPDPPRWDLVRFTWPFGLVGPAACPDLPLRVNVALGLRARSLASNSSDR